MPRTAQIGLLLLLTSLTAPAAFAEELQWRPAQSSAPSPNSVTTTGFSLGAPVPLGTGNADATTGASHAVYQEFHSPDGWATVAPVIRAQAPGGVPPVPPPAFPGGKVIPAEEAFNCAVPGEPGKVAAGPGGGFFGCIFQPTGGRKPFESDHCFDTFISPVTQPTLFEDPRALTEFRPSFSFQHTPGGNPVFNGGYIENLNLRGSVALTDWFSLTVDELGWIWQQPHHPPAASGFGSHSGFTELDLGAKFTFLRNTTGGPIFGPNIAAAGLVFEIPAGPAKVEQDTGSLSLRPYITYGQEFLDMPWGRFHFLTTAAYSLGVDTDRSDHLYLGAHLDYDVAKLNKFFPFFEMNYFLYTANGHARDLNFEGDGLYNFGSEHVRGLSELSLAFGLRYKYSEQLQFGGAFEFGVLGSRSTLAQGFIFDVIFRY
jgi:hypothetical protein